MRESRKVENKIRKKLITYFHLNLCRKVMKINVKISKKVKRKEKLLIIINKGGKYIGKGNFFLEQTIHLCSVTKLF